MERQLVCPGWEGASGVAMAWLCVVANCVVDVPIGIGHTRPRGNETLMSVGGSLLGKVPCFGKVVYRNAPTAVVAWLRGFDPDIALIGESAKHERIIRKAATAAPDLIASFLLHCVGGSLPAVLWQPQQKRRRAAKSAMVVQLLSSRTG